MKKMKLSAIDKKTYKTMDGLSPEWQLCLGQLDPVFHAIIWGPSGNGKTNFVMQLVKELCKHSTILYVALEESFSLSLQNTIKRSQLDTAKGSLWFANHETTYDTLCTELKKKRSPKIVVIDSLQYFNITYLQYKALKQLFPNKSFIFISHAKGKLPDGKTADKIRYDAGLKIRIEGFIAFVTSRFGGNKNYIIWEDGAKKHWGAKLLKKHTTR